MKAKLDMMKMIIDNPDAYPDKVLIAETKDMARVLTPNKLNIISALGKKKPQNIEQLAKLLGRSKDAVTKDLNLLENFAVVGFKGKKPYLDKDAIIIELR